MGSVGVTKRLGERRDASEERADDTRDGDELVAVMSVEKVLPEG